MNRFARRVIRWTAYLLVTVVLLYLMPGCAAA